VTVSTTLSRIVIPGNAATTTFSFPFPGIAASDLQVYYTDASGNITLLASNLYSVVLNPPVAPNPTGVGGTITYPLVGSPIANGTSLTIVRNAPEVQSASFANQGTLYQPAVESAFDYAIMLIQQIQDTIGRALTLPVSDPATISPIIPSAAQRALKVLGFDSLGNPIAATALAAALVSTAWAPVIASSTLQGGRTLAGIFLGGPVFDTKTDAAAATIDTNVKLLSTSGYAAAGDRGGTNYFKDTGANTALTFQSADGAFWTPYGVGRPEMAGAKGDGVVNPSTGSVSGTVDTQAIANAISTFPELSFTPGLTYVVDTSLSGPSNNWCVRINTSNHIIRGNGAQLAMANGTWNPSNNIRVVFLVAGISTLSVISNITVRDLQVYGNAKNQGNPTSANEYSGIQVNFVVNGLIENCVITQCAGDSLAMAGCTGVAFTNNYISLAGKNCIYAADQNSSYIITGNYCNTANWNFGGSSPFFGGNSYAGIAVNSEFGTVTGNICGNCGVGILLSSVGSPLVTSQMLTVADNVIYSSVGDGINVSSAQNPRTCTISIASPAVISLAAHGYAAGTQVFFTTTGALPTGITAGTPYYVIAAGLGANVFEVSASFGGAAVNTSGSQSGTQSVAGSIATQKWAALTGNIIFGAGGNGIQISNSRYLTVSGGVIQACTSQGILLNTATQDITVSGVTICGNGGSGVLFSGATNCNVVGCTLNNNTAYGIDFATGIGAGTAANTNCSFGDNLYVSNGSGDVNGTDLANFSNGTDGYLNVSAAVNPGTVANGSNYVTTLTVAGVNTGSKVLSNFSLMTGGILLTCSCTAANTITLTFFNNSGAGWTPGAGTLYMTIKLK
jgi:hypothetical protein